MFFFSIFSGYQKTCLLTDLYVNVQNGAVPVSTFFLIIKNNCPFLALEFFFGIVFVSLEVTALVNVNNLIAYLKKIKGFVMSGCLRKLLQIYKQKRYFTRWVMK